MNRVFLSLGSNCGDRQKNIDEMFKQLSEILMLPILSSPLMETEPVGIPDEQQWYFNKIISGMYGGTAHELLESCQEIEKKLGRTGKGKMESRSADIDILLFGDTVIQDAILQLPHPQLLKRKFCIEGINSIASEYTYPLLDQTFDQLYAGMTKEIAKQKIRFIEQLKK